MGTPFTIFLTIFMNIPPLLKFIGRHALVRFLLNNFMKIFRRHSINNNNKQTNNRLQMFAGFALCWLHFSAVSSCCFCLQLSRQWHSRLLPPSSSRNGSRPGGCPTPRTCIHSAATRPATSIHCIVPSLFECIRAAWHPAFAHAWPSTSVPSLV